MRGNQTLHAAVVASITFCITGAASAQAPPPPKYVVTTAVISLERCGLPDSITVVIGQNDGSEQTIQDKSWTKDLGPGKRFDADATYARAYFGATSTDCQRSQSERQQDVYVGRFTLRCLDGKAKTLRVLAPAATFHYVRKMNENADCWQGSDLSEERELRGFLFSNETVRLQFGAEKADPRAPGLLIDDPSVVADLRKGLGAELDRKKVLDALAYQRDRGLLSAGPTTAPNGRVFDETNIAKAGLTTLQLRVEDR